MGNLSVQAGGKGDQALVVFFQQLPVDPGLVVKAFHMALSDQLEQVTVALFVFAEQDQVVGVLEITAAFLLKAALRGRIHFTTDNRFQAILWGLLIKINHPEKVSMVVSWVWPAAYQLPAPFQRLREADASIQLRLYWV